MPFIFGNFCTVLRTVIKTKTRLDPFLNNLLFRNDTIQLRVKSVEVH